MNARERFVKCNLFQDVDRVPLMEIGVWGQALERWADEGMPTDVDTTFNVLKGNEHFGLEHCEWMPVNVVAYPRFETEVFEEDERTMVYRDGDGAVRRALKEGQSKSGTRASMDQFLEFAVKSRADFEEMKKRYDPHDPGRYPEDWDDRVKKYGSRDYAVALTGNGGFGFYSMLRRWMGTEKACTIFYDDPALAEEMLDFLCEFFIAVTARALDEVDVDWHNYFEDFAFKTGPLVSPKIFKRFLLPRYRRINDHLRGRGVDIISLDSDGNIEVLLPMIIESGINHICPLEQAAGMDAVRIRKEYGTAFAMLGSIDKRELAKGKKEIENELLRQVPFLMETGGYIPTVDHTVPHDVSYANFMYYLELKNKIVEGRYSA